MATTALLPLVNAREDWDGLLLRLNMSDLVLEGGGLSAEADRELFEEPPLVSESW